MMKIKLMPVGNMPMGTSRQGTGTGGTSGVWSGPNVSKPASYNRATPPTPMDRQGGKNGGATNEGTANTRGPVF